MEFSLIESYGKWLMIDGQFAMILEDMQDEC